MLGTEQPETTVLQASPCEVTAVHRGPQQLCITVKLLEARG